MLEGKAHIGILGLGSYSTLYYIERLNQLTQDQKGGYHTCPFKLLNANFNDINPYLPNQFDELKEPTQYYIEALNEMGVDQIIIPNITLHETIDQLGLATGVYDKIVHPLQVIIDVVIKKEIRKMVVFGTRYSMTSDYIKNYFERAGIEIVQPNDEDMDFIDAFRVKVYENETTKKTNEAFGVLLDKYTKHNPVLLACTELSIAFKRCKNEAVYDLVDHQIKSSMVDKI